MLRAYDNPFAVHRVLRERYRLDAAGWTQLFARLELLRGRGAIVGPHGSGKTTLLEDMAVRLERKGWTVHFVRLRSDERRLPATAAWTRKDIVLCDGAEQLTFLDWRRLRFRAARAGGLVVTTHRVGRLPLLHRCETSPDLLAELTASLGAALSKAESEQLYARHRGNLRDALREMYDRA